MALLTVNEITRSFGGHVVLDGASLSIEPGDKLGLVGRNGGGKSTLLRILEGVEESDGGTRALRQGARIGHVEQRPEFGPGETVRAAVRAGLKERLDLIAAWEDVGHRLDGPAAMAEHDRLHDRIEAVGGFVTDHEVERVLLGVGLPEALWERPATTLSGGEQSRVALARQLVAGHDLLLLDEPTNHLDLTGIEWLEGFLRQSPAAVLVVSHDRRLLDTAVDAIVELEHGRLVRYPARYTAFVELRRARYERALTEWEQQQDFIRREEEFIRRYRAGQRAAEAQGRQKRLDRLERKERPHDDVRAPKLGLRASARGGDLVLDVEDVAGGYGGRPIFQGARFTLARGERVGVVGPNGSGKSTLLKVLAARLPPLAGRVRTIGAPRCGYFDQQTAELLSDGTPLSHLRADRPLWTEGQARDHLARFLFRGEDVERPVAALSGGERSRLALARLVLSEPTWLALDEPTNHLDLASRTALEEAFDGFDGALVVVSHDRAFLDALCTRLVVVEDGRVAVFDGSWSAWRQRRSAKPAPPARTPAPVREHAREKARARNPFLFERLEARIVALESEEAALTEAAGRPETFRDPERSRANAARLSEIESELAAAYAEWEEWS